MNKLTRQWAWCLGHYDLLWKIGERVRFIREGGRVIAVYGGIYDERLSHKI